MSVKVTNSVTSYDEPATPDLRVESHWNDSNLIVLTVDGKSVTVAVREVEAAIKNASNTGKGW